MTGFRPSLASMAVTVVVTCAGLLVAPATSSAATAAPAKPGEGRCGQAPPPGGSGRPGDPPGTRQPPEPRATQSRGIVVRVNAADGYSIDDVLAAFPVSIASTVLATRRIYLLEPSDTIRGPQLDDLVRRIASSPTVIYAERDADIKIGDTRFMSWTEGTAGSASAADFLDQTAVTALALPTAHLAASGAGVTVAVLDTGMQADHPALSGPLASGWDYIGDDEDTADTADGVDSNGDGVADSAVGHGTYVSGLVRLVAPGATILSQRVLDSDGYGTVFAVADAIRDSVAAGAEVVNLSFGTPGTVSSRLLDDTIRAAQARGVVVVGAAGNSGTDAAEYPAALPGVLSVAALAGPGYTCLAGFSTRGSWVQVAAPGDGLVGPVPDGGFASWSGTSAAAPLVSGQVALLASKASGANAQQLVQAVEDSAGKSRELKVRYGAVDIVGSLSRLRGSPAEPRR